MRHLIEEYEVQTETKITTKKQIMKFRKAAKEAKINLCSKDNRCSVEVFIENVADGNDFDYEISKATFERCIKKGFLDKFIPLIEDTLTMANTTKDGINKVLLVGGSSHIPVINELLRKFFPESV